MGHENSNLFVRFSNALVFSGENIGREENLSPGLIPTISNDMHEQLKLAHQVAEVADRANKKICVTLPRYNVDKTKSSYDQFRLLP